MITEEVFVEAIEVMRLQKFADKKSFGLLEAAFQLSESDIFNNDKLYLQIIDLLSIWFDKSELTHYCFEMNFGKPFSDSEWETPGMFYNRLLTIKNK